MKKFQPFQRDGETWLREIGNPYQMNADLCELELYHDWNKEANLNSKIIINPIIGKTEYTDAEIKMVYQYFSEGKWRIFNRHKSHADYIDDGCNTRETYEYIGETEQLETDMKKASEMYADGIFSLLNSNNPSRNKIYESAMIDFEQGWGGGQEVERNRIIGLIKELMPADEISGYNQGRGSVLRNLLTKIKQS